MEYFFSEEKKIEKQQLIEQKIRQQIQSEQQFKYSKNEIEIKAYFESLNTTDPEIIEIKNYFKKYNWFPIWYPYIFTRKYNAADICVFIDEINKMRYVLHENKRLYFPENMTNDNIRGCYNTLLIEQDKDSPHRYEFLGEGGIWQYNC